MPSRKPKPQNPSDLEPGQRRLGRAWQWGAVLVALAVAGWLWRPSSKVPGPSTTGSVVSPTAVVPEVIVPPQDVVFAQYAGSESCRECHAKETESWVKSNHALAERQPDEALDLAAFEPTRKFTHGTQETEVRKQGGRFEVTTKGTDGVARSYPVDRVIGHHPLRQYLVSAPGGRWQTLEASWDPRTNDWFNVYGGEDRQPGEWGHWTGRGMNWNSMCGTCHNTRYRKNYDPATDQFSTAMAERSVGCEACHGPLKEHVSWQRAWQGKGRTDPTLKKLTPAQHMENCAPCHARRSELTGDTTPGQSFWDQFLIATVDGSRTFYPDGQIWDEDYEYAPFLGSRMHAAGVTCLDCHDPHATRPKLAGNDLCLQCHNGSRTNTPVIVPTAHSFHGADSTGNQCVNCHMPQTVYMQRHWRHDHGFTTPDPLLTREFGIPNACNRCHTDKDAAWAEAACDKWYGTRMDRPSRRRTRAIAAARVGREEAVPALLEWLATPEVPYWKASAIAVLEPWVGQARVREVLVERSSDPHPLVRYRAVQALGPWVEAREPRVTQAVRARLGDPFRAVRFSAAWALRDTGGSGGRAAAEVSHALRLNSDQPVGQAQLGAWAMAGGSADTALGHYAKSVAWDPGSPVFRHDYAVALSAVGRSKEAVEQLREAVRLEPGNAENHYRLALGWSEAGDVGKAAASLEEAVRIDPGHDRAWYNLGLAQSALGRQEKAVETLVRAEQVNGRDPRIPYARATVLAQLGRMDEAREAVARALQIQPGYGPAVELRGQLSGRN
ncbi:MAG: tetratricopeptide repeat protein [Verrucomicrobiales bacterium]|nr:tetratricopeptide repeat protein [Verrucomicrobiales bacterium]